MMPWTFGVSSTFPVLMKFLKFLQLSFLSQIWKLFVFSVHTFCWGISLAIHSLPFLKKICLIRSFKLEANVCFCWLWSKKGEKKETKCLNGVQINKIINGRGNGSVFNVAHYIFMSISEFCVDINFKQTTGSMHNFCIKLLLL